MSRSLWVPVLLFACAALLGCKQSQSQTPTPEPPKVNVSTPPTDVKFTKYEVFTGRTQAYNYTDIRARVTGYLKEAKFKEGEDVKEGKVLFVIDPRPYEATLNQANANLTLQKAQLTYNEADYNRLVGLRSSTAVSQDEMEKARAARDTGVAAVKAAEAAVKTAELNVEFTKVLAPFSGRISRRQVDPGSLIQADTTIMGSLVDMDQLYAYFDVDERTLLRIRHLLSEGKIPPEAASKLSVTLGFANEKPEDFSHPGTLKFSDNKVDTSTGTLRMWGIFENQKHDLFSGLFIRVRMQIPLEPGEEEKWHFVSELALGSDQGTKYLFVLDPGTKGDGTGVVRRVNVEPGQRKEGLIAVKGLKGDEKIVVSNLQRVREKMEIPADNQNRVPMPRVQIPVTTPAPVANLQGSGSTTQGSK